MHAGSSQQRRAAQEAADAYHQRDTNDGKSHRFEIAATHEGRAGQLINAKPLGVATAVQRSAYQSRITGGPRGPLPEYGSEPGNIGPACADSNPGRISTIRNITG